MQKLNFILTAGGLHLVANGKPVAVAKSDTHFAAVLEAIKNKATPEEVLDIIEAEKKRLEAATQLTENITLKGGQVYYKGEPVARALSERMVRMVEEGFPLTPMTAFLENLMLNPSYRAVEHLYAFLEHGQSPITDDGHFLVYKAIRKDWTDIRTGTFNNSIGQVVEMPRNRVDEDPNRTCSFGLHVCSHDYLPHFSHADGHVVLCKVNPRDVVSIPVDYNNTKMRVCRYEVLEEHPDYYSREDSDVLTATAVASGIETGTFQVLVNDGDGTYEIDGSHDRLVDAASRMEELLEDSDVAAVRIVNVRTGAVVDEGENEDFDGSAGADDSGYSVVGIREDGDEEVLESDQDSIADAVAAALNHDGYDRIEIRDANDLVVKTLS